MNWLFELVYVIFLYFFLLSSPYLRFILYLSISQIMLRNTCSRLDTLLPHFPSSSHWIVLCLRLSTYPVSELLALMDSSYFCAGRCKKSQQNTVAYPSNYMTLTSKRNLLLKILKTSFSTKHRICSGCRIAHFVQLNISVINCNIQYLTVLLYKQ